MKEHYGRIKEECQKLFDKEILAINYPLENTVDQLIVQVLFDDGSGHDWEYEYVFVDCSINNLTAWVFHKLEIKIHKNKQHLIAQ